MKILIPLIGGFGNSGGWRVLSQLANYWLKSGNEVVFLAHASTNTPYFPTKAQILYYNNLGEIFSEKTTEIQPRFGAISMQNSLRIALDKLNADVVLATHSFTAKPISKSKINAKKFYYIQAYEPDYYYRKTIKDKIYQYLSRKSYSYPLLQIVNAPMYMQYKEIFTDKFVFPGLDLEIFSPKDENEVENSKFVLGTIGRLEKYKGTTYIVEAFKKLRDKLGDKIELHIAFGDNSLNEIEGIKVLKPNNDLQLSNFYKSINVYICAGTIQLDAVHYPVIEAMACKTPVISTGYLPTNPENSYFIEVENSEKIYDKVLELLNTNKFEILKKTEKALLDIQDFEWENVSRKMFNYFKT